MISVAVVAVAVAAVTTKSPSEIPLVTSTDLARELAACPRGALAFDGDGTLWSGDVGEDFFFGVLDSGKLSDVAAAALTVVARSHIDVRMDAAQIGRELYQAYLAGNVDEELICEVMTWISAGWTPAKTREFSKRALGDSFASRIHPEARAVIDHARAHGHDIWVVSASPRPIVEAGAAAIGVPPANVIAATTIDEDGHVTAAVHRPIPYGPGKASALRRALGDVPLLAAFGDSAFDGEMLLASERPIAIRPKPRLLERAEDIPRIRRLAME